MDIGPYVWPLLIAAAVCVCVAGKPTFIVPFFGDQPFWGAACLKAGVGPAPVSIDDLNTERVIEAFKTLCLPT